MEPLPASTLSHILHQAVEGRLSQLVQAVAEDFLRLPIPETTLSILLLDTAASTGHLNHNQVIRIFQSLPASESAQIPSHVLSYISQIFIEQKNLDISSVERIVDGLLQHQSTSTGHGEEDHRPGTWSILRCIISVVGVDQSRGLQLLHHLLSSDIHWPPGVMDGDSQLHDAKDVVLLFTIRCCTNWRWWNRAFETAQDLVKSTNISGDHIPVILSSLVNLLHAYMDPDSLDRDLRLCAALICSISESKSLSPLPNATLQRFYASCVDSHPTDPETASHVYLYLKEQEDRHRQTEAAMPATENPHPSARNSGTHQPPQTRVVLLLLNHYAHNGNQRAAQLLIADVRSRISSMTPAFLLPYLIVVIRLSFATHAREIYEYLISSPDMATRSVANHPAVASPLVSLYLSRAIKFGAKSNVNASTENTTKAEEYWNFAVSVAKNYTSSCSPLSRASHKNVTTLLKVQFAVGWFHLGSRALQELINRDDIVPDSHDFTVILNTLSLKAPSDAIELLDFMVEEGLEPDESAYGVVSSGCMRNGNVNLAFDVLEKAKSRGRLSWDPKALGSILWNSISPDNLAKMSIKKRSHRLEVILNILGSAGGRSKVFRERTFGSRAARAAIGALRPDLAYQFWSRCLKDKTISSPTSYGEGLNEESWLRARILEDLEKQGMPITDTMRNSLEGRKTSAPRTRSTNRREVIAHQRPRLKT